MYEVTGKFQAKLWDILKFHVKFQLDKFFDVQKRYPVRISWSGKLSACRYWENFVPSSSTLTFRASEYEISGSILFMGK